VHRPGRDGDPHGSTLTIFALSYGLSRGCVDFVDDPASGRQVHQTLADAPQTWVDIHQRSGDLHPRAVDAPRTLRDIHRHVVDIHPIPAHVHAPLGDPTARAADIRQRPERNKITRRLGPGSSAACCADGTGPHITPAQNAKFSHKPLTRTDMTAEVFKSLCRDIQTGMCDMQICIIQS